MTESSTNQNHITQAEFARRREVSRATVTGYKNKGLLVMTEGGLVDVKASEELLTANMDPVRGGDRSAGGAKQPSAGKKVDGRFMAARTAELEAKAARQHLLLEKDAELLVVKELVQQSAFTLARTAQEALIAIPDRLSSLLAVEGDAAKIHEMLTVEIRRVCNDLAKGAEEAFE